MNAPSTLTPPLTPAPAAEPSAALGGSAARRPERRRRGRRLSRRALGLILVLLVVAPFVVPLYWMIRSAVMPNADIYSWPPIWFPLEPTLENLRGALEAAPFGRYAFNSVFAASVSTLANVVMAALTAYAFAYLDFPAKRLLFLVVIGALMVPGHITLLVNYLIIAELGLVNTYLGLILPGMANAFGTFLFRQHFLSLPLEVLEAAQLDGAGHLRRLLRFVVPMSFPIIITVTLITLIGEWNGFVWPLIVLNSESMRTLPIGLMYLKDDEGLTSWGPIMAGTLMVALPMLILYLFAHRQIVTGLTGAGIRS
ncbi:MAG: carbohydrate ABC transporter permease [Brachybacterium sp.]